MISSAGEATDPGDEGRAPTTAAAGGGGGATEKADQEAVAGVLGDYEAAYTNQDSAALAAILADDVTRFGVSDSDCTQAGSTRCSPPTRASSRSAPARTP